jgi:hypothetical protein
MIDKAIKEQEELIKRRKKLLRYALIEKNKLDIEYQEKKLKDEESELKRLLKLKKEQKPKKNPKSAEKKYKDFHHREDVKKWSEVWNLPDKLIYIGKVPKIYYISDKRLYGDDKTRQYVHELKKYGDLWISPDGMTAIITNLSVNIKKEGLTG